MIAELKPYAEYQATLPVWFGEVPSHWGISRLGAVFFERGETNEKKEVTDVLSVLKDRGVIPYAEKGRIGNKASEDVGRYKIVRPDDIVMNCMNVIIGSVGRSRYTGCLSPVYYVLRRRNQDDNPRFLELLFKHQQFHQSLVRIGNGILAHRMRIPMEKLKAELLPLPPPDEQAAIVRFLDHWNGRLEKAIRAKRRVIALLQEQKQAIIHRAVTRGLDPKVKLKDSGIPCLGKIPEHWETPMNSRIFRENIRPHNDQPEDPLSLSQRDGLIKTEHMQERSLKTSTYHNWKLTIPGDLVANRFKAHLGVFFAAGLRGIVSFHYAVFEPQRKLNTKYFELLYHTAPYRTIYAGRSNGMTVGLQNLSNQNFYAVRAVVPPLEEQDAIVAECEVATRGQDAVIARLEREIALLREYRTRLTADVVTGKLDVRAAAAQLPDPEDFNDPVEDESELADEDEPEQEP